MWLIYHVKALTAAFLCGLTDLQENEELQKWDYGSRSRLQGNLMESQMTILFLAVLFCHVLIGFLWE